MLDTPSKDGSSDAGRADDKTAAADALRAALRLARSEAAEQTDVVMHLRQAEIARLESLKDALDPVFTEVPQEIDLFDIGLAPGERPRLFVDMVTFVEMGHDRRTYRLMRDGRSGRVCAAESAEVQPIVQAVTAYVARRLVERERLLVDDERSAQSESAQPEMAMTASAPGNTEPAIEDANRVAPSSDAQSKPDAAAPVAAPPRSTSQRVLGLLAFLTAFGFGAGLGAVVVGALIIAAAKGKLPI